ncbi:DUF1631 family protein [Noviherbaspirillum denitrificans]|uniref:DUF1631 domain-containing protein n=1 Tax=Noviherbaspirillum denitrificans TaxID=1968433 RepID=A0A254TP80_9BURK|nr:DUF1631 family protein [Noviherbaspirillum denitrificans]OWW22433.1 hypothetical protein AYR66_25990 [Noviherbaspirillum denitrificans]
MSPRAPGKSAIAPDRLAMLHTMAFAALRLCAGQLDAFTSRLEQVLEARIADAAGVTESELFQGAHQRLQAHRATFQRLVADSLQRALMQAVQDAADHAASVSGHGALDLSHATFAAMERKVIVDNLSQAMDRAGAAELAVLSLRIAHWLDVEEIGSAHNPFRSAVFLKAIADAWSIFDPEEDRHRLVLRQMDAAVFLDLVPVWQALNQELALRKVLPDAECLLSERGKQRAPIPPPPADEALRQWLAPEGMLTVNVARADALADDMLAWLMDFDAVPARIRQLLATEPLKQAILGDPQFFFDARHTLRRALESILAAGLGCRADGEEDVLIHRIAAAIARLPGQCEGIADELDILAARESRVSDERLRNEIAAAVAQENIAQAERRAQEDVRARIESGEVEPVIETFLREQWLRVLVFAYGIRDAKPDVLDKVRFAMDDLVASVQPRQDAADRKALAERLPSLLSLLNAWLNVVKWEGQEREAFFSALAGLHATAMRGPDATSSELERRMDRMERASEHDLDRRAEEQRADALAPCMQEIARLLPGAWCEFVRNDGSRLNCKLLWVSPAGSRFIFTGRQGQLLFTLDRDGLAQGMYAERVAGLPVGEFVTRAIAAVLPKLL